MKSSTGTEQITGIQIKTSNKRGIISYTNNSLNCVGNQQTVHIPSDEIRPIKQGNIHMTIYNTRSSLKIYFGIVKFSEFLFL